MIRLSKYRNRFLEDWYSIDAKALFIVICLLYFATLFIKRTFIIDEIAAFEILQERGEMWLMDLFFGLQYLSVPLFLAWKITTTTFLLWAGCFLFGYRLTYRELWKMVLIMELIFIVPELVKVLWFVFIDTDPTYQDYVAYYPASLINLFDYQDLTNKWHYPLKALNLFEILYWMLLVVGIYWLSNKKMQTAAFIVFSSYVFFYLLWLGYFVMAYR